MGNRHHIGTARMTANPKDGVVDTNLKVHSVTTCSFPGSAVFTNGGHAVPTMIIMAFSIRLAEHFVEEGCSMKKWFCAVALAPVSLLLPWLMPAWQGPSSPGRISVACVAHGLGLDAGVVGGTRLLLLLAVGFVGPI